MARIRESRRARCAPRALLLAALGGAALALPACQNDNDYHPYTLADAAREWKLGGTTIHVEVAQNKMEREQGLMFRTSMADDHGMLFVYPRADIMGFWMKNTPLPLSIAFIEESGNGDGKGTIVNIEDMQPFTEYPSTMSLKPVRLALEMNQGWFARHQLKAGDTIDLPEWFKSVVASGK